MDNTGPGPGPGTPSNIDRELGLPALHTPAPYFDLEDVAGERVSLAGLDGPVALVFMRHLA